MGTTTYQHVLISDIQSDIESDGDVIIGNVNAMNDWVFDTFDCVNGVIGAPPYYFLALDFSENEFRGLMEATIQCGANPVIDLLNDEDKIVILDITEISELVITQTNGSDVLTQTVDLTGLTYLFE